MKEAVACCGFGGTFCVKYPDISNKMVTNKTDDILGTGADLLLAGDLGCLMNMGGKLSRRGEPVKARHVVEVARQSLELGLAQVRPGAHVGDIGWAIQQFAQEKGCSVVRDYTGHGIGRKFHTEPSIPHYGIPGTGPVLRRGMTFTIEPMINLGTWEIDHLDDGWTVLTRDGEFSAQFEHTIVVTRSGCEVLTRRPGPLANSEDKDWAKLGPLSCYMPAEPVSAR